MGGFLAVCTTDFIQGSLMLIGLLAVPILAYGFIGGDFAERIASTNVTGGYQNYMNLFMKGDRPYTFVEILSQLAWGLGYCGMPHVLVRFMAVKSEKEVKKSSVIAITWCFLSLVAACLMGVIGRAFLAPGVIKDSEGVFIQLIERVFTRNIAMPFIGGVFLCGILAAIMSTADSQLLVCASSVSKDIFKNLINPKADDKTVLRTSRFTVLVIAVLAFLIAWDPNSSIMELVSDAWAGLGSAFGPAVVCALFWKRANLPGTVAGILSGGLTVIVWDYLPIIGGKTIGAVTGVYSLLVGFAISMLSIVIISLCTKAPEASIVEEFEKVNNYTEN